MRPVLQLQDIEEMRREQGIDDVELRLAIRALRVGDSVKVSLTTNAQACETVPVRITAIQGSSFRGMVSKPKTPGRSRSASVLTVGFTTAHIHSIVKRGS